MGKIRRKKFKAHMSRNKEQGSAQNEDKHVSEHVQDTADTMSLGPFKNVSIDVDNILQQRLAAADTDDARTVITSKSFKGLNLSKKTKAQIKKEVWKRKVDAAVTAKEEQRQRKRRQQAPVVGDMRPLADTLPTLELLMKTTKTPKEPSKAKPIKKTKTRQREMMKDIDVFNKVLQDKAFQANPFEVITEHLANRQKQDELEHRSLSS